MPAPGLAFANFPASPRAPTAMVAMVATVIAVPSPITKVEAAPITVATIATLAVGARGLAGKLAQAKPGAGMLLLRGFETAAALLIVAFGALLLTGYMVSERLVGI